MVRFKKNNSFIYQVILALGILFSLLWMVLGTVDYCYRWVYIIALLVSAAIPVCINCFILIPYFFIKNKNWIAYIIIQIFIIPAFPVGVVFLLQRLLNPLYNEKLQNSFEEPIIGYLICIFAGSLIRFAHERSVTSEQMKNMEIQRLEMELNVIRLQINPHFLFNTFNNLYGLTLTKSDKAPEVVLTLSNMMRYSLYETKSTLVPLEKEVDFLKNYIAIQSLRVKDVDIKQEYDFEKGQCFIAPHILVIFVENAFKHGINKNDQPSYVHISIKTDKNSLIYEVENNYKTIDRDLENPYSGIGLQSAKRLLELTYPAKYSLEIDDQNNIYRIKLKIDVN